MESGNAGAHGSRGFRAEFQKLRIAQERKERREEERKGRSDPMPIEVGGSGEELRTE